MALRVVKVIDDFQLLTSIEHGLWGSNTSRFSGWKIGDVLVISVNKALAAMGTLAGKPFRSEKKVWDNAPYPYRIPVKFEYAMLPEHRPLILGAVRDALTAEYGAQYGFCILNQVPIADTAASIIFSTIKTATNDLQKIKDNMAEYLAAANVKRAAAGKVPTIKPPTENSPEPLDQLEVSSTEAAEESKHTWAQQCIIELGKISGCLTWVATNDKNKTLNGKSLGTECLKTLPNLGLSAEAMSRISLIDALWLLSGVPVSAFEVETSTSIFSGLLRMADLLVVCPAIKITLFIVAPKNRLTKFAKELTRPTFQKIGLSDYCRFIAIEELTDLLAKVKGLDGYVSPTILDKIAVEIEEPDNAAAAGA